MTDGAGDDVERNGRRKPEQEQSAQDHQAQLEAIQGAPLEVTLTLENELVRKTHGPPRKSK
jgi:hypothetical protein